jgi:DNA-binding NarL/FixJ family response regulator
MNIITRSSKIFTRVLIVDNQGIMGAGLEKLLSEEPSLEVYGTSTKRETTLLQEIWHFQPDIIILTAESKGTSPTWLLNLLKDYGGVRIILISMDQNVFEVYDKQQITTNNHLAFIDQIKESASLKKFVPQ